jgi:hypothetical protein
VKRVLALLVLVVGLALPAGAAASTAPSGIPATGQDTASRSDAGPGALYRRDGSGWTDTKPMVREMVDADGTQRNYPIADPFRVTVSVDHTHDLRGRERVLVSWKGAQASAGRAGNPYGLAGIQQEYPVVVLQCRGTPKTVKPETCWTSSYGQRSVVSASSSDAVWTHDLYADEGDRKVVSGMAEMPDASVCPAIDRSGLFYTHLTPFVAANGKVFPACDKDHMPPEAAVDSAFPPAEIAAFTDINGRGSVQFEVRSDVENESLGCNHETACSIVVIPILGLSCDQASSSDPNSLTPVEKNCRRTGRFPPGSSNFAAMGVDPAVSPLYWWTASNWRNRFVVPITMGLPPDACDLLDPRSPTGFYGSELLAQAALQWAPAYCLRKDRFKFQLNQMSDEAGWNLMESGGGAAAEVSSEHQQRGSDPVAYAPTAVTGFGIGYVMDKPENAGEYTRLRLNARLLAKLITQSYSGSGIGAGHPGMGDNPWGIMADPEFVRLNPGLSQTTQEAGAALLSLSNSSDIIWQLTDYIAHDKDAMAFIHGKPDPWGMKVNPSYKNLTVPRVDIPMLDTFVPKTGNECLENNPMTYFANLAAPVTTLKKISDALIDAWPNLQTRCDTDVTVTPHFYKIGRVDRQSYGARFMLGLVSLGDAARFGIRTAALETKPGTYVGASEKSLSAAIALSKQGKRAHPFVLDQGVVRRSATAYPGTMVVYTAARTQNLGKDDAGKVAQFIRVSTSEGQRTGSGNGELPGGFLPIQRTGVTAKLYAAAQDAADAIAAQKEQGPGQPDDGGDDGGGRPSVEPPPGADEPPGVPDGDEPSTAAEPSTAPSAAPTAVDMPATAPVGSDLAGGLLPLLILLGAIGCVATIALRVGGPVVRRWR